MYQNKSFSILSETGPLKQVMLHRPGRELDRLTISNMDNLLFDDLIWLEEAQREHDEFANILRKEGCEVLYFYNCLAEILEQKEENARLYQALASLPEKQRNRIYAHFFLGMSKSEIAKAEGTHKSRITRSINAGLRSLEKFLKEIS